MWRRRMDTCDEDWWQQGFFIVFFFQFEFVWLILINEIKRYNYIIIITTICHVIIVIYHLSYSLLFIELFTFVSVRHLSLEWKTLLNEFSSFYREPFIIAAPTGLIETSTTLLEGRLGLTNRKPSWPSTGTHLSLRSVLAWKSMNSSGLLSSTSRLTLCTHWSPMGNTAKPHCVVIRGKRLLVQLLLCKTNVTRKGSMHFVR